jgi:hypothetical protein
MADYPYREGKDRPERVDRTLGKLQDTFEKVGNDRAICLAALKTLGKSVVLACKRLKSDNEGWWRKNSCEHC